MIVLRDYALLYAGGALCNGIRFVLRWAVFLSIAVKRADSRHPVERRPWALLVWKLMLIPQGLPLMVLLLILNTLAWPVALVLEDHRRPP